MRIDISIRNVGLAAVGWGFPWPTGADIVVFRRPIKITNGVKYAIYIPATSFKGALRSATSRIAEVYKYRICGSNCNEGSCDVNKLFGTSWMEAPSKLRVSDFYTDMDNAQTLILTRIRIEDPSQRAADNALFTQEYLAPGTTFIGEIEFPDGLEEDLVKLLLLGLAELRLGRLGRGSIFDLKIRNPEVLHGMLDGDKWIGLLEDLGRWLWNEVL